jgi:hypothetical protein
MVPSSTHAVSADGECLACGRFSLSKTVRLGSFEFIADYIGGLSHSPRRDDSGTTFIGSTCSGPPSPRWAIIEDSTEEFRTASSGGRAPGSPLLGGSTRGSACSRHNHTVAGGRSGHSIYDDGSTMGASAMAGHRPLLRSMAHSTGWAMSACPRWATQRRVGDDATVEQAHRQANNGRSLTTQAVAARACARDREDPNGELHCHQSSGQGSSSLC